MVSKLATQKNFKMSRLGLIGRAIKKTTTTSRTPHCDFKTYNTKKTPR